MSKAKQDRLGIVIIVVSVGIALALSVIGLYEFNSKKITNPTTLCPSDGIASVTIILFDMSDPCTPVQKEAIRKKLDAVLNSIPKDGMLKIYSIGDTRQQLVGCSLEICNPGDSSNASSLYQNKAKIGQIWQTKYVDKIAEVIEQSISGVIATSSPIVESIQSVSTESFWDQKSLNIPKRLILVSDMIQHSSNSSHYRGKNTFEHFKASSAFKHIAGTNLQKSEIQVLYIRRDLKTDVQGKSHMEWWQSYFAEFNGLLTNVTSI